MSARSTKDRILDAAEEHFAQKSYDGTSLREVTSAAEVNLAAVHYHFGSKMKLFRAVFERRIGGINEERIRLLDEAEARAGDDAVPVEEILEAFLGPALRLSAQGDEGLARFMQIVARVHSATGEHVKALQDVFREIHDRFLPPIQRALPDLCPEDLYWRIHFLIGSMALVMSDPHRINVASGELCASQDCEEALRQLVAFAKGAMTAPSVSKSHPQRGHLK